LEIPFQFAVPQSAFLSTSIIGKYHDRLNVINQGEGKKKRMSCITVGLLVVAFTVAGCGHLPFGTGWVTLIDGQTGLENWNRVGGANWRAEGDAIAADKSTTEGSSFLVTKNPYKDFEIRAAMLVPLAMEGGTP
jgi:hypothetical protein